jgi:hypothetical protein
MVDEPNLVLEHLRHIRGAVDGLRGDMREVKQRLERIENRLDLMPGPNQVHDG